MQNEIFNYHNFARKGSEVQKILYVYKIKCLFKKNSSVSEIISSLVIKSSYLSKISCSVSKKSS